jgi:hypothetical protein
MNVCVCVCVWVRENSPPHLCLWVKERTNLPSALPSNHTLDNLLANKILDGRTDPDTPKRIPITLSDTLVVKPIYTCKWMCVCAWVREYSPPHLCLWVRERTHLLFALPSNHTSDNLLANRILDGQTDRQTDTHDLHDIHWGIPWHWVIPIMDTQIPMTLSDTDTLSDFSFHGEFSQPTQEFTHQTEGPCFPHKQTGH